MKPSAQPPATGGVPLTEVRFSLRAMLADVAMERQVGAFGAEKLHQKDISKLFRRKTLKPRAPKA